MLTLLACHSPLPAVIALEPMPPPTACPGQRADITVTHGDCRGWIGYTSAGDTWEGNPDLGRLSPGVGAVTTLVGRFDQVLVGGSAGAARRVWVAGRPTLDQWAPLSLPPGMTSVRTVDAEATAWGAELWYADDRTLCHSDGGAPTCMALPGVRSIAAMPEGAWVTDAAGGAFLVPIGGSAVDRSDLLGGRDEPALAAFDTARGVVWFATKTKLMAVDPPTGELRHTWDWRPDPYTRLALSPEGVVVSGGSAAQRGRFVW